MKKCKFSKWPIMIGQLSISMKYWIELLLTRMPLHGSTSCSIMLYRRWNLVITYSGNWITCHCTFLMAIFNTISDFRQSGRQWPSVTLPGGGGGGYGPNVTTFPNSGGRGGVKIGRKKRYVTSCNGPFLKQKSRPVIEGVKDIEHTTDWSIAPNCFASSLCSIECTK